MNPNPVPSPHASLPLTGAVLAGLRKDNPPLWLQTVRDALAGAAQSGRGIPEAAAQLQVSPSTLKGWIRGEARLARGLDLPARGYAGHRAPEPEPAGMTLTVLSRGKPLETHVHAAPPGRCWGLNRPKPGDVRPRPCGAVRVRKDALTCPSHRRHEAAAQSLAAIERAGLKAHTHSPKGAKP